LLSQSAPHPAFAWGDEGHEIIALIAEHYLDPAGRDKVPILLAADTDTLTGDDIASEATWADKYRDSDRDTTKMRYQETRLWHFVDIELAEPKVASACFGHPGLPPGVAASRGPPRACVADKMDQFAAEVGNRATTASEQLLALKFLSQLVGDLHRPLHAADYHDSSPRVCGIYPQAVQARYRDPARDKCTCSKLNLDLLLTQPAEAAASQPVPVASITAPFEAGACRLWGILTRFHHKPECRLSARSRDLRRGDPATAETRRKRNVQP
jgi:hypothetical protein